jgi:hypothetical protein
MTALRLPPAVVATTLNWSLVGGLVKFTVVSSTLSASVSLLSQFKAIW